MICIANLQRRHAVAMARVRRLAEAVLRGDVSVVFSTNRRCAQQVTHPPVRVEEKGGIPREGG